MSVLRGSFLTTDRSHNIVFVLQFLTLKNCELQQRQRPFGHWWGPPMMVCGGQLLQGISVTVVDLVHGGPEEVQSYGQIDNLGKNVSTSYFTLKPVH